MSSRIAHHLDFPDYSLDELVAIGELMLSERRYRLSPEAKSVFRDYLARRMTQPRFANARSVRNALERARLRHASRLIAASGTPAKDDLMRLEPADFLASRVFTSSRTPPKAFLAAASFLPLTVGAASLFGRSSPQGFRSRWHVTQATLLGGPQCIAAT